MIDDLAEFEDEFENDFFCNDQSADRPSEVYLNCLKEKFGHFNFRPMQWKVISSILEKKQDNCVVMATGYGKSLCYQFPSVYLDAVTMVISPLISLMEDQVLSLTVSNIKACLLGTAQKDKSVLNDVFGFAYNIIYVTPEFITCDQGSQLLQTLRPKLTLIAVDEAHCISKWGHDFRPAFRNLCRLRKIVPEIPILAMTATATEQVRNDIVTSLELRNPQVLCTGFDRPNLEFNVRVKSGEGIWNDIGPILLSVQRGSIIIYCITRSETDEVAGTLLSHGINCAGYHAGHSIKQRKEVHEGFVRDKVQVVVATIASGMGIDKPDVRMVIHYGVSKDIESYYQEVGRAGRDGMPSKCYMFYARSDFQIHQKLRENSRFPKEVQQNLEVLSSRMSDYVNTNECRRRFLLTYFEGTPKILQKHKNCCDNCRNNTSNHELSKKYEDLDKDGLYDFTTDAENLMKAIEVFNGYTGLVVPILLLRGSKDQKLNKKYYNDPMYGVGKNKCEEWYKSLADLLERNKYLEKHALQISRSTKTYYKSYTIALSKKGITWLGSSQKSPIKFKPQQDMYRYLKKKKSAFLSEDSKQNPYLRVGTTEKKKEDFQELVKTLIKLRASFATSLDVMPYMIASNKALYQIAQIKPLNLDELKAAKIDGFSDIKVTKFGPEFIKCVLQSTNFLPNPENDSLEMKEVLKRNPVPGAKISETHLSTLHLWTIGKSIEEIAQIRGLSVNTISNYMADLIKAGYCATKNDLRKLGVVDFHFKYISARLPSDFLNIKLKDIKDACEPSISYDMIKYVLSYYQVRKHLKQQNLDFIDPDNSENVERLPQSTSKGNKEEKSNSTIKQLGSDSAIETNKNLEQIKMSEQSSEDCEINDVWGSDSDIDFSQIDEDVNQFNKSVISIESIPDKVQEQVQAQTSTHDTIFPKDELDLLISDIRKDEEEARSQEQKCSQKSSGSETKAFTRRLSSTKIQYCNSDDEGENELKHKKSEELQSSQESGTKNFKRKYSMNTNKIEYENSSSDDERSRPRALPGWLPASNSFQNKAKKKATKRVFS